MNKNILKNLIWGTILAIGISIYYNRLYGMPLIFDSFFMSGLLFLCSGLFRVVLHLELFNSTIFTCKKFYGTITNNEYEYKQYSDFLEDYEYKKSPKDMLIPAVVFIAISCLTFI